MPFDFNLGPRRMFEPLQHSILLVEDQATDIIGPYQTIQHLGIDVTLAFDGAQALAELRRQQFSLVILDWNMPLVSGAEFLTTFETMQRRRPQLNAQKIVIHTGQDVSIEVIGDARYFSIVDIWKKPLTAVEMLKRLKSEFGQ